MQLVQDLRLNRNSALSDDVFSALRRPLPPVDPKIQQPESKTEDGADGELAESRDARGHAKVDAWFFDGGDAAAVGRQTPGASLPLVCLDISGCTHLSDASFVPVMSTCSALQQLRMQLCDQVTGVDVVHPPTRPRPRSPLLSL